MRHHNLRIVTMTTIGLAASTYIIKRSFFPRSIIESQLMKTRNPIIRPIYDSREIPNREDTINFFKNSREHEFDVLIIGGGASGAGCALDATTRGLSTALIEKGDFASGTSSKSTKLIHGGVRYLEKAFLNLDREQYYMVKEALYERFNLMVNSPHTSGLMATLIPIFGGPLSYFKLFYYYIGMKVYDFVAGNHVLAKSTMISRKRTLEIFPTITRKEPLVGSILYFDGQHNDARTNLELALTAAQHGSKIANYTEVIRLIKETDNQTGKTILKGALCKDVLSGESFEIRAKSIINAAGPYTDNIRQMSDEKCQPICSPSRGTHISVHRATGPTSGIGILQPHTKDGRIIFILPWEDAVIAGTTDISDSPHSDLKPSAEEIDFILKEMNLLLDKEFQIDKEHVKSSWTGLRPLIRDPEKLDTQSLVRNHLVIIDDNGLVSITGGKWTTYRSMAEETIDKLIKHYNFKADRKCITETLPLHGSYQWNRLMPRKLAVKYNIDLEVCEYLVSNYGDQAENIINISENRKLKPLADAKPNRHFEEEVIYCCRHEYCEKICDVILRRMRLIFTSTEETQICIEKVAQIMATEKKWDKDKIKQETSEAINLIETQFNYAKN